MFVIVVGCGRVGAELAYHLFAAGHQVAVIDHVGASFDKLHPDYRGRTIEGEVLAQDVLQKAGIEQADGLASVTNIDSVNAVVGHIARDVYGVRRVVVRNYDPRWLPMHQAFGHEVVSSTAWGAQRIEELLADGRERSVFSTPTGEVQVFEVTVPAAWNGRGLAEVLPAQGAVPVALTRGGRSRLPAPGEPLEAGDVLHVSTTPDGIDELRRRIGAAGGR
jgi:trk system potassium uptake protein TrkA